MRVGQARQQLSEYDQRMTLYAVTSDGSMVHVEGIVTAQASDGRLAYVLQLGGPASEAEVGEQVELDAARQERAKVEAWNADTAEWLRARGHNV